MRYLQAAGIEQSLPDVMEYEYAFYVNFDSVKLVCYAK